MMEFEFEIPKEPAGFYEIGKGFRIGLPEKPMVIYRLFTRLFLGRKWIDN